MKALLYKEWALALHPTVFIFWALSLMLLIPNYPYYVVFFYTCLGIFFVCLTGRETHDITYTVSQPVRKKDVVSARVLTVVLIQLIQMVLAVPIAFLRAALKIGANEAGMDANLSLFGISLILLGVFNFIFFTRYYRAPDRVGSAFAWGCTGFWGGMIVAEGCTLAIPAVRGTLDTPDPQFLGIKLAVLALGLVLYTALTAAALKKAQRSFVALDL